MSAQLHAWVDLTFGYQLAGDAAVAAKNVALPPSAARAAWGTRLHGRAQLFARPHPPRLPRPGHVGCSGAYLGFSILGPMIPEF